jgi:two-component system C4-dicarboxylate transport sensor histidine kinase DctB
MIRFKPSVTLIYTTLLVVVSLLVGLIAVHLTQLQIESNYVEKLNNNAKLRADEITSTTVNGQVMGSVATLGLLHQPTKSVAKGELPMDDPTVVEALSSIGTHFENTTGVYMVMPEGVIGSNWYPPGGKPLTGSVVKFRPYFTMAMQGLKNVYVAIGTTTGVPALYFAAPLYSEASSTSPIIGATVVRINTKAIESILNQWTAGPALLLSPQSITLLSNKTEFNALIAKEPSAQALKEIKALKQFGSNFEKGTPKTLPFDIDQEVVTLDGKRYALARATIDWRDPLGPWTFLLLGELDGLMNPVYKVTVGMVGFGSCMLLAALAWAIRKRLIQARLGRLNALNDLQAHNLKLEAESVFKNFINTLSSDLHLSSNHADFAQRLISHVAPRIRADYLAVYTYNDQTHQLMPFGGFGVRTKDLPEFTLGEGLVGQCAKNKQKMSFESEQDMPIRIVWGQGCVTPQSVLLLPLIEMNEILGVMVIASAKGFDAAIKVEINSLIDTIAIQLGILNRHLAKSLQISTSSAP